VRRTIQTRIAPSPRWLQSARGDHPCQASAIAMRRLEASWSNSLL
jgi:hypothetical protein